MFFGDRCSALEDLNTSFIRFFQIAIIPYMTFSIVHSIGALTTERAKRVGKKGGIVLICLWAISIFYAFGLQYSFPNIERSKFFRPENALASSGIDFFDMFIPSNPFHSFANGYIPAIVIFCILLGVALINHKNKAGIVKSAKIWSSLMSDINEYVMLLLPLGVLVMSTYTFGTLSFMKLKGLLLFVVASTFYLVFISMIIYPFLISSVSKFNYRKFLNTAMPAALIGFTTGSVFLSLPVIYDQMYKFNEEEQGFKDMQDANLNYIERGRNAISILVPLAWVVPASYKFLVIFYIVFAHWYYDRIFPFSEQLIYYIGGIPCLFGSNSVVVPFLLDMSGGMIPNKAYDIFMILSSFLVYFNNANGSIFIVVCTILCYYSLCNKLKIRWFKLLILLGISTVFFIIVMGSLSFLMTKFLSGDDEVKEELTHMNVEPYNKHYYEEINARYLTFDQYHEIPYLSPEEPLLDKIARTKTLQVGYDPEAIPFAFFNSQKKLVGYDIDFINTIAQNLRCNTIEFYKIDNFFIYQDCIAKGTLLDICVGGYTYMAYTEGGVITSAPYMKYTPAIVIPMEYKEQYPDLASVFTSNNLSVGVRVNPDYKDLMPDKHLIGLKNFNEFYQDHKTDALLTSAEIASATCILYHGYWVYYYSETDIKIFYAYLMPYDNRSRSFRDMVNTLIDTAKWDGTAQQRYEYWIMGETQYKFGRPWSVLDWLKSKNFFLASTNHKPKESSMIDQ
ncbi:MAG: hypothetical protein A2X47_11105 [Lentisphaerae bacterium GWF2_38_69]|nr:MAG: hypothetical protein A2X47_11105 [Lentisphaerae bacterium GWF2_38_69]